MLLAQMFLPSLWIPPITLFLYIGGWFCGIMALVLRIFGQNPRAGSLPGKLAIGIGVALPILSILLRGVWLFGGVWYLCIVVAVQATPILPG
jgi:hypothetical protein